MLNSYQYQYILAIAEYHSISKAAAALFVSQPYLSKRVAAIEKELGTQLFDRSRSPLLVTPAGECYLKFIREILHSEQKMKTQVGEIAAHRAGVLTIGFPQTHGSYILPYILKRFKALYPGIRVKVDEQNNCGLVEHLLNGTLDLCCISLPEYPKQLDYVVIKQERILLVMPPDHPLGLQWSKGNYRKPEPFPVDQMHSLSSEKFIILTEAQGIGQFTRKIFQDYDIHPEIFMETRNIETAYRLAANGIGLTFIPEISANFSCFEDPPHYYSVGQPSLTRSIVIAYAKGRELSQAELDFIHIAREST